MEDPINPLLDILNIESLGILILSSIDDVIIAI